MLFKQKHLEGIKSGGISLAFRRWEKPAVKIGSIIKTSVGLVKIDSIGQIDINALSENDAIKGGFKNRNELVNLLGKTTKGTV